MTTYNRATKELADSLRNIADLVEDTADSLHPNTVEDAEYLVNDLYDMIQTDAGNPYEDVDLDDEDY